MMLADVSNASIAYQAEYAGFASRAAAKGVDFVILLVCGLLFDLVFRTTFFVNPHGLEVHPVLGGVVSFLLWFTYETVMVCSKRQATLGKRALGIIVTDLHGNRVTFARAALRCIGQIASAFLFVGYLVAAFTRRKQAFHDLIAGTLVSPGSL
jgi:uncharacterized RDD family membrane protein YckC